MHYLGRVKTVQFIIQKSCTLRNLLSDLICVDSYIIKQNGVKIILIVSKRLVLSLNFYPLLSLMETSSLLWICLFYSNPTTVTPCNHISLVLTDSIKPYRFEQWLVRTQISVYFCYNSFGTWKDFQPILKKT
jgi:hypothetical protein